VPRKNSNRLVLTGGGTAGHVMPNLALVSLLRAHGWQIYYIGSAGMEKGLVEAAGIEFHTISVGKLRRYLSLQNLLDIFRLIRGCWQAWRVLGRIRPAVVFSKGGFVSVPVAIAAYERRIPVVTHESDVSPGLANRIIGKVAKKIIYCFPETARYLPSSAELVGCPIRQELLTGVGARGLEHCGFSAADQRPVILVMGGSQGAESLNQAVASASAALFRKYRVIHLTGRGKSGLPPADGYCRFEFLGAELADVFACVDLVVSRAGANAIFEFLTLKKPMLLIPLVIGSRGDQVLNAASFAKAGWSMVLQESELDAPRLLEAIDVLWQKAPEMIQRQSEYQGLDAVVNTVEVIDRAR